MCSFAMTKAFQSMKPQDFVKIDNVKEHREMIQLYTETIKYYDKNQFEDLNKDVYENVKSLSISASRLSRYILKQESEPLFGLKMKQSHLKILYVSNETVKGTNTQTMLIINDMISFTW